jgi:hypothetical protein
MANPNKTLGKIEIIGFKNSKSAGPGVVAVKTTKKEIKPKQNPKITPDLPLRRYAPINTGIWIKVIEAVFIVIKPKKGKNPMRAKMAIIKA